MISAGWIERVKLGEERGREGGTEIKADCAEVGIFSSLAGRTVH